MHCWRSALPACCKQGEVQRNGGGGGAADVQCLPAPPAPAQVEDNLGALAVLPLLTDEVVARINATVGDAYE